MSEGNRKPEWMLRAEEVAARARAHRERGKGVGWVAPKVDVTLGTLFGTFVAVIPIEVETEPGSLLLGYTPSVKFFTREVERASTPGEVDLSRLIASGNREHDVIACLRQSAKDIEAFCDGVEIMLGRTK